jgi:hypothetical protein
MTRRWLALWMCGVCFSFGAGAEPPLPVWNGADAANVKSGKIIPGSELLNDDPIAEAPAREPQVPLAVAPPTQEELRESLVPPNVIPEKFLDDYFERRPETYLVDPQRLLGKQQYQDRLEFLKYHAGDSSMDLFIYLFDGKQEIPGEVRAEELVERFFSSGRPAVVVYYFVGAPQRSVIYLSPSLTDAVSAPEQRRALESSVMEALNKSDPADQLERFGVQMSIRIYWMERMLHGGAIPLEPVELSMDHEKPKKTGDKTHAVLVIAQRWAVPAGGTVGGLLAVWLVLFCWRARSKYRFPALDVAPRLGASHAAGVGAVISFGSPMVPPSVQRDQVPDYLHRV